MASIINATTSNGVAISADNSGILQLATNSGTTAITVDTSQNVGIGTSLPGALFDVQKTNVGAATFSRVYNPDTGGTSSAQFQVAQGTVQNSISAYGNAIGYSGTLTNHPLALITNNTERMRIDTSGNVGIGTSSPAQKLEIAGGNYQIRLGQGGAVGVYDIGRNPTDGIFKFYGYQTGTIQYTFGGVDGERMRIDSSGNLLVGQTTVGNINGNGFWVSPSAGYFGQNHINGTGNGTVYEWFAYNGTAIGTITQSGTTGVSYNTSSDYRLKNTIAPMTGALAKVASLKPVTYKWNADNSDGEGFIAHELAEVCPHAVTGEKDAVDADGKPQYQGIDTSFLVATLTAAIQELKAIVDAQALKIAALEAK